MHAHHDIGLFDRKKIVFFLCVCVLKLQKEIRTLNNNKTLTATVTVAVKTKYWDEVTKFSCLWKNKKTSFPSSAGDSTDTPTDSNIVCKRFREDVR